MQDEFVCLSSDAHPIKTFRTVRGGDPSMQVELVSERRMKKFLPWKFEGNEDGSCISPLIIDEKTNATVCLGKVDESRE